jgi:hypothetical protein
MRVTYLLDSQPLTCHDRVYDADVATFASALRKTFGDETDAFIDGLDEIVSRVWQEWDHEIH